jgi:hypothetical protein
MRNSFLREATFAPLLRLYMGRLMTGYQSHHGKVVMQKSWVATISPCNIREAGSALPFAGLVDQKVAESHDATRAAQFARVDEVDLKIGSIQLRHDAF